MPDVTAILTESDKEFIVDEMPPRGEKLDEQWHIQRRYNIRQKIQSGIEDLSLLRGLDEGEMELIFENLGDDTALYMRNLLIFVFNGVSEHTDIDIESLLAEALRMSGIGEDLPSRRIDSVDVEINYVDGLDPDAIREKFDRGDPLSNEEIGELVRREMIEPEEMPQLSIQRQQEYADEQDWWNLNKENQPDDWRLDLREDDRD